MKRNKFSLSHFRLMSCTMGQLVPLTWFEVLPGDTVQQATSALVRAAPLVTPPMHPVHVRIHHFFVPNRIIWQGSNPSGSSATGGWENFITGGPDGLDATAHPYVHVTGAWGNNTLSDYLGLPTVYGGTPYNVNALPYRAYQLIWNEFFRDQDLQTAAAISTGDGADATTSQSVQNVAWQKDYYTTCRPWEAKGPGIGIFPSGTKVPVLGIGFADGTTASSNTWRDTEGVNAARPSVQSTTAGLFVQTSGTGATASGNPAQVFADLGYPAAVGSNLGGADINSLRRMFALQRFQEARAKYGSRYVEYLRYLGIRSSDARLQRPEYLGGGTSTIQFSEVLQTGVTTSGTQSGVGQMFGHGISAQRTNRYRRFFEEHGIVMTMMSVRPITVYTNPVMRKWLRGMTSAGGATAPAGQLGTREDYFTRELQNIGQQVVAQIEVDAGNTVSPATTFGYQDRYDEYRRHESQVSGQFRAPGALNTWHFARSFGANPTLNSTFVSSAPSVLPFADQAHDTLYVMANHSIQARRMMSRVGQGFAR